MQWSAVVFVLLSLCSSSVLPQSEAAPSPLVERSPLQDLRKRYSDDAFLEGEAGLSAAAAAGREIWYKATGGNAQFHAQTLPALGFIPDWAHVFDTARRGQRWRDWGLINDPSCCTPGARGCPAQDAATTYGFDWCAGDEDLLAQVGKDAYTDPACRFREAPVGDAPHNESACLLAFGTSAGAIGFRKFPNPKFDAERWRRARGKSVTEWDDYPARPTQSDVEPPFLIGIACAACHAGFDPLNAPRDPNAPTWNNIRASVGNQYLRFGALLGAGLPTRSWRSQLLNFGRPGTVDTSLIEDDYIANPSSINAIINFTHRPAQPNGVLALMKGGEDGTGLADSTRRVYLSMGVCASQCLVDHLAQPNQFDSAGARYAQSPVDANQCRRECAPFRALDERLEELQAFMQSRDASPTDLRAAREALQRREDAAANYTQSDLIFDLEREFGRGAVDRGRRVFATHCATCHSSLPEVAAGSFADRDFVRSEGGQRVDWLGSDTPTAQHEVGTNACRALHSNHLTGNIWQTFASTGYQARGRGYYRNISLLSAWAHAPFMHNNAVGPALCEPGRVVAGCWQPDPSVAARYRLYKASMRELLSAKRQVKRRLSQHEVAIRIELVDSEARSRKAVHLLIPPGTSEVVLGSFASKPFARDLAQALYAAADPQQVASPAMQRLARQVRNGKSRLPISLASPALRRYVNCADEIENRGHGYGTKLDMRDKNALIAFVATL